jgi:V/A-type H+/Na+-transporting ATPase subunit K
MAGKGRCHMRKLLQWFVGAVLVLIAVCLPAFADQAAQDAGVQTAARTIGLALAAAVAVGLSILGAGYAVAKIGSAALGAAVEKPELLTRSILFVALAEGLAVLGFAIAMMLLQKI